MRDLVSNIGAVQILAPAVLAATNTSAAIDLAEFGSAAIIVTTGAIVGAGDFTAKLQHSDLSGSGFVDADAADLIGALPASLEADGTVKLGYIGSKRFIRLVTTKNGGTSIAASALLIKGNPRHSPVA